MAEKYILALDQGTTSSRAMIFDHGGLPVCSVNQEFPQIYPKPGWVEHDPIDILESQISVAKKALRRASIEPNQIAAIAIANQRETTIVWDRKTGKPVHNAIVWQCRRTSDICDDLRKAGLEPEIRRKTGLVVDAYFSSTKLSWILSNLEGIRKKAEDGDLLFGTVDSWLIWNLTNGKVHATDCSNASRTMLFNIHTLQWDEDLLEVFKVPRVMLPRVNSSSFVYGYTAKEIFGDEIPIAGVAGDQQAALFGQTCFEPGSVKNTYGTGSFILMNTGTKAIQSHSGLLTTMAWSLGKEQVCYALEGSVFVAGAVVQWLRDGLKIIEKPSDTEYLASSVPDSAGVYFVPAFVGLGAPYWDMYARGTIVGITRGTTKEHVVRAALESIAYQTRDVVEVMSKESGIDFHTLKADGGASANDFLMQFQADILGVPVERPEVNETTALGAAYLAGLAVGYWKDIKQLKNQRRVNRRFVPAIGQDEREDLYRNWKKAVSRSLRWVKESTTPSLR